MAQHPLGGGPVDALVGDGDAVAQLGEVVADRLVAGFEVALDHQGADAAVAAGNLLAGVDQDLLLPFVVLEGVGVAAVDHDAGGKPGLGQHLLV